MSSVNKVILVGHMGRDPETRYTQDSTAICTISLATSHHRKDRNTGERIEDTEWHRVVFYSRLAEVVGEYARKGSQLYIEGRLRTRKWQDKDGIERYTTEIIADRMQFIGGRNEDSQSSEQRSSAPSQSYADVKGRATTSQQPANLVDMADDVPF